MRGKSSFILSIITLAFLVFIVIYGVMNLDNLKALDILVITMTVCIYMNGLVARMIHMSRVKMEAITYGEEYRAADWYSKDLGLANVIPVIMEIQYTRHLVSFIEGVIESYREEELRVPLTFKIAHVLLKAWVFPIFGAFLLFSLFVLPLLLNDYTLYRGLNHEELHTAVMGIAIFLQLSLVTIFNYTMFNVADFSMEGQSILFSNKLKKWFIVFTMFFVVYTAIMVLFILFMGLTGITIPIFSTVINTNTLSLFIISAPIISLLQAMILKGKLSSYQYILNEELS